MNIAACILALLLMPSRRAQLAHKEIIGVPTAARKRTDFPSIPCVAVSPSPDNTLTPYKLGAPISAMYCLPPFTFKHSVKSHAPRPLSPLSTH
jgi:hypothetical protein